MISKEQFFKNVDNLPEQILSTGRNPQKYRNIRRQGNSCTGIRESNSTFELDLDILYDAYKENDKVNTNTLLYGGYIRDRKRSPAVAIMAAAGLLDNRQNN